MKHFFKILLFVLLPALMSAQSKTDSLKHVLAKATDDSARYNACWLIYNFYEETNRDSALFYAQKELSLSRKNHKLLTEAQSLIHIGYQLIGLGRYAESLQHLLQAFKIAEDKKNNKDESWLVVPSTFKGDRRLYVLAYTHHIFAILMWQTENKEQEIVHFKEARRIASEINHPIRQMMADMNLGRSYLSVNKPDSGLALEKEAEQLAFRSNFKKYLGQVYQITAEVYLNKGDKESALHYYYKAMQTSAEQNNRNSLSANYFVLAKYYLGERQKDSALKYAMKNLEIIQTLGPVTGRTVNLGTVYENILLSYKLTNKSDSIFKYQGLTLATKDSLYKIRIKNITDFQNESFQEQMRLQSIEREKVIYQNKVRTYFFLAGIGVLLVLALIFYNNNRQKHKAKIKIEKAYDDLKATQQQLIQSEKMASLGELTAGIAHEIQNPLNFVNNFSEVNSELIAEIKGAIQENNTKEIISLAENLDENEKKILFHGKRADAIVKSMLQHSRSGSGKKELTDINALTDEYLRLAYHGLRAKDNKFNASMKTDFDQTIGNLSIIPQDIGRVILNLITNAFYAVTENKKEKPAHYEPTVIVRTKRSGDKILISVKDNGNGIPKAILDKIFQPFFTTKPTGQGTGLGLSLSYDIVKAQGGELKVETKEGEGSEFIILLPDSH